MRRTVRLERFRLTSPVAKADAVSPATKRDPAKIKRDKGGQFATTEGRGGGSAPEAKKRPAASNPEPQKPATPEKAKPEYKTSDFSNGEKPKKVKGVKGAGTKDSPYMVEDVNQAAAMLAAGSHLQLTQTEQVSTLLDQLKGIADDAIAKGDKAPVYDLCKVSLPGTNLFCADSKGIPRVQMPQLSGKPDAGSKAAKLQKNTKGEVDLAEQFVEHMEKMGIEVEEREIDSSYLKASQNELNGAKVAGISAAMSAGKIPESRIFVADGGYVVDGHHRWAAQVGQSYREGRQVNTKVRHIKSDIITVLKMANDFSLDWGIPQASVSKSALPKCIGCGGALNDIEKTGNKAMNCWEGYERVPGTEAGAPGSCRKKARRKKAQQEDVEKTRKQPRDTVGRFANVPGAVGGTANSTPGTKAATAGQPPSKENAKQRRERKRIESGLYTPPEAKLAARAAAVTARAEALKVSDRKRDRADRLATIGVEVGATKRKRRKNSRAAIASQIEDDALEQAAGEIYESRRAEAEKRAAKAKRSQAAKKGAAGRGKPKAKKAAEPAKPISRPVAESHLLGPTPPGRYDKSKVWWPEDEDKP